MSGLHEEVVGEAGDGLEALKMCETHRPDVAILDIAMPRLNGIDVAERPELVRPRVAYLSHATGLYDELTDACVAPAVELVHVPGVMRTGVFRDHPQPDHGQTDT